MLTFSVITPVFNGVKYATSYVETLQRQTYVHWQAIVVDDGSTDGSLQLLSYLCGQDHRFVLLSNDSKKLVRGPYQARNKGLQVAAGDFICFLDIDDSWFPDRLELCFRTLVANPDLSLLYSAYLRIAPSSSRVVVRRSPPFISPHLLSYFINPIPMLTSCVSRRVLVGLQFPPVHHEDYIFWYMVLRRIGPHEVFYEPSPTGSYLVHPCSVSSNKLRVVPWIWNCYLHLGYSLPAAIAALVLWIVWHMLSQLLQLSRPR